MKKAIAIMALAGIAGIASADMTYTFDLSNMNSDGSFGSNFQVNSLMHDFGAAGTIVGVDFDVAYESFSPSWISEARIAIDTADDVSIDADPNPLDYGATNDSGVFSYAGSISANSVSSDGIVYLTLFETFDDGISPDATYMEGSIVTVHYEAVPAPAALSLLGLGGIASIRRRR